MRTMKKIGRAVLGICLAVLLAMPVSVQADDTGNDAVKEAGGGVVQVLVTYVDADNYEWIIQSGSGFFIGGPDGADTIVTNHHVVTLDEEVRGNAKETFGRDIINDIQIKIVVDRDLTKTATITELNSEDYDIAVLKLEEPLAGMKILSFSTEEPQKTQSVSALGFPDQAQIVKDKQFYTTDDVTITSGTISDITEIGQTKHIQHECKLTSGNSGGPLVNENGEVIGVNRADVDDKYFYSVKASELTKLLDKMNIPYNTSSGTVGGTEEESEEEVAVDKTALQNAIKDAEKIEQGKYTEDSYDFLAAAIEDGKSVMDNADATQEAVDSAAASIKDAKNDLVEESGIPMAAIIGIVAAVIIIFIVIVVIVVKSKKKKALPAPEPAGKAAGPVYTPPMPNNNIPNVPPVQNQNMPNVPPVQNQNMPNVPPMPHVFDMAGSDETSVLNEGAGQTTVLSAQSVPAATLRRTASGETAIINKSRYILGKEKSKVDFCISNNSSISRVHAEITCENGEFYITDKNATNFTFVNGNKVNPGQKVKINNGDKIKLSDEEFEFKA